MVNINIECLFYEFLYKKKWIIMLYSLKLVLIFHEIIHFSSFTKERGPLLEQNFFDLEIKMEGDICRDLVSLSPEDERRKTFILSVCVYVCL
jgi:hypothetical protein